MKFKQTLVFMLLTAFAVTLAFGQDAPMARDDEDMPMMGMQDRLNLSDTQRDQIAKLRTEFQKQHIAQRAKLQTARVELRELIRAENPNQAAIEKKITEVSQFEAQQRIARTNHLLAVRKILTPEQQKIARETIRGRMQHRFAQRRFMQRRMRMHEFRGPRFRGRGFGRGFEGRMDDFNDGFDELKDFEEGAQK